MNMSLTPKQEAFAIAYVETGSAAEAYRRAYDASRMKPETVWTTASRLLDNPKVAARVGGLTAKAAERAGITKERWLRELALLAFSETADVAPWDERGPQLIPSDQLPREKRAAVKSIKVKRRHEVSGQGEDAVHCEVEDFEVVMHDKKGPLDSIGKALGWTVDKVEHSGEVGIREYVGVDIDDV